MESLREIQEKDIQVIMISLGTIHSQIQQLKERVDCILHTLCKNNDLKTNQSICKFLTSDYRNKSGYK